jgi:hypothetical protein
MTTFIRFILLTIGITACGIQAQNKQSTRELLTAHQWQLVAEQGLNLSESALARSVIEFKPTGEYIYYEKNEKLKIFTQNNWVLANNQQSISEVLPDGSKVVSKIAEISENTLKLVYQEKNNAGHLISITETYQTVK